MAETLRERALQAVHEREQGEARAAVELEARRLEMRRADLHRWLKGSLEIDSDPATYELMEAEDGVRYPYHNIDGLTFTVRLVDGLSLLYLISPCAGCGYRWRILISNLGQLGEHLRQQPPARCARCEDAEPMGLD